MRAFLFATATQALVVPSRRCLSAIQTLRTSVFRQAPIDHRARRA
jgi:hypothetical protein